MFFATIASIMTGFLKVVGIILLIAFLLLVLLILLIIFSPVFYKVSISKDDSNIKLKGSCIWSGGLIYAQYNSFSEEKKLIFRIFGISYSRWGIIAAFFRKLFLRLTDKRESGLFENDANKNSFNNKSDDIMQDTELFNEEENYALYDKESLAKHNIKGKSYDKNCNSIKEHKEPQKESFSDRIINKIKKLYARFKSFINNINIFIKRCIKLIRQLVTKSQKALKKVNKIYCFISNKDNKAGITKCFNSIKKILKEIVPRSIKGDIFFGTDDPYTTGQILAFLGITYSLYGDRINIHPDFESGFFIKGNILLKGHIQLFTLIKICIKLYKDDDFKKLYNNYKLL